MRQVLLLLIFTVVGLCQIDGNTLYRNFCTWRQAPENAQLEWTAMVVKYSARLKSEGFGEADVAKMMRIIEARDEATLYDPAFAGPPAFQTAPSALLKEAAKLRSPGKALDVAMGQGRNSIHLAQNGWNVTGFDVSAAGLREAQRLASAAGVQIRTVLSSDEEFDFGVNQWDLIAILYPIEKRSVFRVREALKPGGIVVVECSHRSVSNGPYEYETGELLRIFAGFRILKYVDAVGTHEWARKELRLVRIIAQK